MIDECAGRGSDTTGREDVADQIVRAPRRAATRRGDGTDRKYKATFPAGSAAPGCWRVTRRAARPLARPARRHAGAHSLDRHRLLQRGFYNRFRWLAKLMRFGLLQASCIPPKAQRDLRGLTRYRTKLVQERVREVHRVQGVLERANIKLASVIADIMGVSGRVMLEALIAGRVAPATMADLAKRRMRSKIPLLEQALTGIVHDHHRQWLAMQLAHIDLLDEQIEALTRAVTSSPPGSR